MERSLNVQLRAKSLDELLDCESVTKPIAEGIRQGRVDNTYIFTGPPGTGKTTIARIVAKMVQGQILEDYDIEEPDTGDLGADEIRELCRRSRLNPWIGKYKAIILDEAHKLSTAAMTILLKDLEEASPSCVWFICSSEPGKLPAAIMRRGSHFSMPELTDRGIDRLVSLACNRAMDNVIESKNVFHSKDLVQALIEQDVRSGGLVLRAAEKFITGVPAEEAARTSEATVFDAFAVAKATAYGDWNTVQGLLKSAPLSAARVIRGVAAGFFRSILVKEPMGPKAERCVWAIETLANLSNQNQFEDGLIMAATAAALYKICAKQKESISKR